MGQDGQGFPLSVFTDQTVMIVLSELIVSEKQTCCFREGPLEMGIADFAVLGAELFSCGLSGAFDQTAIGDELLDPRETMNVMDFVKEDQSENLTDTGDGS